jgi:heme oxygenase (mycobilin-producing)
MSTAPVGGPADPAAQVVSVLRFSMGQVSGGVAALEELADVLGELPGCQGVELARATEDPQTWVLVSTWGSVGDYRRALSSYEVKMRQPLLSGAEGGPSAFEVLYSRAAGEVRRASSGLAIEPGESSEGA